MSASGSKRKSMDEADGKVPSEKLEDEAAGEKNTEAHGASAVKSASGAKGASGSGGSGAPSSFNLFEELNSHEEDVVTGAVEKLSDVLSDVKKSQEEKEETCSLVLMIGGAFAISSSMLRFASEDAQAICLRAVGNLAFHSIQFCKTAEESGLLDRIVDALKAYPEHNKLPNYAFAALSSLSKEKSNAVYIVEQLGIVPFITKTMEKFKGDTEIQADASCLLNTLLKFAETKNTLKKLDKDSEITSLLKVAMKTHTDENEEFVVKLHKDATKAVEQLNKSSRCSKGKMVERVIGRSTASTDSSSSPTQNSSGQWVYHQN